MNSDQVGFFFSSLSITISLTTCFFFRGGGFSMLPLLKNGFDNFSLPGLFLVFLFSLYYFRKLHLCRLM